jgi:hypothetical protein
MADMSLREDMSEEEVRSCLERTFGLLRKVPKASDEQLNLMLRGGKQGPRAPEWRSRVFAIYDAMDDAGSRNADRMRQAVKRAIEQGIPVPRSVRTELWDEEQNDLQARAPIRIGGELHKLLTRKQEAEKHHSHPLLPHGPLNVMGFRWACIMGHYDKAAATFATARKRLRREMIKAFESDKFDQS